MEIGKYLHGGVTVLPVHGELTSHTAGAVQARLSSLVPDDGSVLLDLGGMTYISSAGLRVLLLLYRQVRASGVRLALVGMSTAVADVLAATGFLDFFTVADSVDDGVRALVG